MIQIQTNDGETRVMTPEEHQTMVKKYGENNLPYSVMSDDTPQPEKKKIYGGPEPYPPGYPYKNY